MPETGTVKWFDAREGKQFGFIKLESEEEIFFHYNDGSGIEICFNAKRLPQRALYEPYFVGQNTWVTKDGKSHRLKHPQQGDILVFQRSPGQVGKGDKAKPWGYYSSWKAREQWIADHQEEIAKQEEKINKLREAERQAREAERQDLAKRPVYRVRETISAIRHTLTPDDERDAKVIWQGQDIHLALKSYQRPYQGFDDFELHSRVDLWWEIRQSDGSWKQCPDPR